VRLIESWDAPFREGWEEWRPDPSWTVPVLPVDWDRRDKDRGGRTSAQSRS
jgi:hypothetical protein